MFFSRATKKKSRKKPLWMMDFGEGVEGKTVKVRGNGGGDDEEDEDLDPTSEKYKAMMAKVDKQNKIDEAAREKKNMEDAQKQAEEVARKEASARKAQVDQIVKLAEDQNRRQIRLAEAARALKTQLDQLRSLPNPAVFLDIEAEGENDPLRPAASLKGFSGRLVFELFRNELPMTAENFRKLCTGEMGENEKGEKLCYRGSLFHRIVSGFVAQGGDITMGDGTGGTSVYGDVFADEGFIHKHKWPGMLSMANSGADSNGSQFYVTLRKCPWLDGMQFWDRKTGKAQRFLFTSFLYINIFGCIYQVSTWYLVKLRMVLMSSIKLLEPVRNLVSQSRKSSSRIVVKSPAIKSKACARKITKK